MRLVIGAAALVLLAGCDEAASEPSDEEVIASVEAANNALPPLEEVVPEPILYPDIEAYDLFGAACSYAPGTSLGARVIARQVDAFMKIDGDVVRFAADPGASELPQGTRSLYTGLAYTLHLAIAGEGEDGEPMSETRLYEGTITLRDAHERVVYTGTGAADCGV